MTCPSSNLPCVKKQLLNSGDDVQAGYMEHIPEGSVTDLHSDSDDQRYPNSVHSLQEQFASTSLDVPALCEPESRMCEHEPQPLARRSAVRLVLADEQLHVPGVAGRMLSNQPIPLKRSFDPLAGLTDDS